jgi:Cu-Zn family superoxide dismutase
MNKMGNQVSVNNGINRDSVIDCNNNGRSAICVLEKVNSSISGCVYFHQCSPYDITRICFELRGPPGETHAIHIHEFGDIRDGCKSLGLHFNPFHKPHGSFLHKTVRHAGDLINNEDPLISLFDSDSNESIIGRSIVIHEGRDDEGQGVGYRRQESLISGNAGKRVQCGIIGLCKIKHF